ncbi:glucans biosynthesis protein MdoC [Parafrankia sp. BMG5.11]|nr:glucans biosynthesis protein MdoC [Parafrankia sp. BMG5.11]
MDAYAERVAAPAGGGTVRERGGPSGPSVYYHHLDALRGVFMLVGVFVHASTLGEDPVFDGIGYASSLFRMEGFFVISGFLAAMVLGKHGARAGVRRRLASVGTPLVFTLVLVNPPTLWLTYNFHNDPNVSFLDFVLGNTLPSQGGDLSWYLHLWFLFALIAYALLSPAAVAALSRLVGTGAYRRVTAGRLRAMAAITLFVVGTTVVIRGAHRIVLEPVIGTGTHAVLVEHTLEFLPFYLLGVLLHQGRDQLVPFFQRPAPVFLAVTGLALLASKQEWVPGLSAGTGLVLTETLFSIPLIATLFALAARLVPGPVPAVRYLADASYTVYLLHFFWIYVFATVLSFDPGLRAPQMLLATALTFGVTLATHHFAIRRSPLLRKIFNGKFGSAGRPTAIPAVPAIPVTPASLAVDGERTLPLRRSRLEAGTGC